MLNEIVEDAELGMEKSLIALDAAFKKDPNWKSNTIFTR